MAAIVVGNTSNPIKQSGSKLTISITSVATLTEAYEGLYSVLASQLPTVFSHHPTFTGLQLSEFSLTQTEATFGRLDLKYEGPNPATPDGALPPPVYELIRGNSTEPIDTHPAFVSTIAGTPANPIIANNPVWNSDKTFKGFATVLTDGITRNPKAGVQSYLDSSMTFKKTYLDYNPPDDIGVVPRIDQPGSPAPQLTTPRSFMLMNVSWTRRGGIYEISQEWLSSGRYGWDTDIYPNA